MLRVLRFPPDSQFAGSAALPLYAALVVEGEVLVGSEKLGAWDFMRVTDSSAHEAIRVPRGATLLAVSLQ